MILGAQDVTVRLSGAHRIAVSEYAKTAGIQGQPLTIEQALLRLITIGLDVDDQAARLKREALLAVAETLDSAAAEFRHKAGAT